MSPIFHYFILLFFSSSFYRFHKADRFRSKSLMMIDDWELWSFVELLTGILLSRAKLRVRGTTILWRVRTNPKYLRWRSIIRNGTIIRRIFVNGNFIISSEITRLKTFIYFGDQFKFNLRHSNWLPSMLCVHSRECGIGEDSNNISHQCPCYYFNNLPWLLENIPVVLK